MPPVFRLFPLENGHCRVFDTKTAIPFCSARNRLLKYATGGDPRFFGQRTTLRLLRGGVAMKDMVARLDRLRKDAAECELIRDSATDRRKRELFERLAGHLKMLAKEVERAIVTSYPPDTFLGRKTQEPFPKEEPNDASVLFPRE